MKNIYNYLKEYGNITFKEKTLNNIDYSIFSLLSYLDFTNLMENETIPLQDALRRFIDNKDKKEYVKNKAFQKDIYDLATKLPKLNRYKDIRISNYVYKLSNNEQFGALTLNIGLGRKIISFEGTDDNLSAWEEDLNFFSVELTPADKDAINYLNKAISIFDKEIIVVGHSKGGRLSVTASMYQSRFKQDKIKKIYSFDGPGILKEYLDDRKYLTIKNKIEHIIPNYSLVGVLLNHDVKDIIVKSFYKDVRAHSIFNWEIEDTNFVEDQLSDLSQKWQKSIEKWLERYSYDERKLITRQIFNIFRDLGYNTLSEVLSMKNILNIILNTRKYDDDTKKVLIDFFAFNLKNIIL